MENFDELFEKFFNEKMPNDNIFNNESFKIDKIKKIIETLGNFKNINEHEDISNNLGEPSEIHEYEEDGILYKKLIWDVPNGKYVKIIISENEFKSDDIKLNTSNKKLTLEEQLKKAVDNENYELAVKLRDKIKSK